MDDTLGEDFAGVCGSGAGDVSCPRAAAARRWRSGQAEAVKRTTAGVWRMTDMPWGTSGVIGGVAGRTEVPDHAGDGIGHAVREVDAGVAEADAGHRGGEEHLAAGFVVAGVFDGPRKELGDHFQGPHGPDVADRVRALIGGAQDRPLGAGPFVEGNGGVGFEGVTEHVEAGGSGDGGRQSAGVVGIDDAERRPEVAVGDAGFGLALDEVKDGDAGGFAAGAGGGGNGDQRLERAGDRLAVADRGVDVVEEVSRIGGIEVGGLGRVDACCRRRRRRTNRTSLPGDGDGIVKAAVGGLDLDGIENFELDFGRLKRFGTTWPVGRSSRRGSMTRSVRLRPMSSRSMPTSRVMPGPKRRLEVESWKAVSNSLMLITSLLKTYRRVNYEG